MEQIQHFCKKELKRQAYRIGNNGFGLLGNSKSSVERAAVAVINYASDHCSNGISLTYKTIALNECESSDERMSKIVDICINAINKMATYDFLTGVRNRNFFEKELAQWREDGVDAYYLIADLNNLKETNDAMRHSAGDEFAVLWKGTDVNEFLTLLEKKRVKLNEERIIPLNFAIGYGKILEENGIVGADEMMYGKKRKMKAEIKK